MELALTLLAISIIFATFIQLLKIKQNGKAHSSFRKDKEKANVYTPPRRIPIIGDKKLTPEQQRELFEINKKNLYILKQMWKHEHL